MSLFHKKLQQSQNQLSMAQQQADAYRAAMQNYQNAAGFGAGLAGALQTMGQPIGGYAGIEQWRQPVTLPEEVVVHALVGWRRWSVSMFGETLKSNNGVGWEPYKRIEASCSSPTCAGINCGCGIYSYKERKHAEQGENAPSAVTHIWGEVWLWGRVIEHSSGYRAQFAYPKAFVNTGGISQRLAYVYGVKLIDGGAAA